MVVSLYAHKDGGRTQACTTRRGAWRCAAAGTSSTSRPRSPLEYIYIYIRTCIYIHTHTYRFLYIYVNIRERERERERDIGWGRDIVGECEKERQREYAVPLERLPRRDPGLCRTWALLQGSFAHKFSWGRTWALLQGYLAHKKLPPPRTIE